MAYKCIRSTFANRIYEEDVVYDAIGAADKKYFVEVAGADDAPVVETGLLEEEKSGNSEPAVPVAHSKTERAEIKEALTELGIKFKGNASNDSLKEMLLDAQSNALEL